MGDRTPEHRRPVRSVEDGAIHRHNMGPARMNFNNNMVIQSFAELNQAGMPAPQGQLPAWYTAKVNQGLLQIPADRRQNVIELEDIEDGDIIVRIQQLGQDFFYLKKNWDTWMMSQRSTYPNRQVENPANRVPVTADQIDIFTAQVMAGGRRTRRQAKRATRRRSTRRRRATRHRN